MRLERSNRISRMLRDRCSATGNPSWITRPGEDLVEIFAIFPDMAFAAERRPMRFVLTLAAGIDRLNRGFGWAAALLCGSMVAVGAMNALARYYEKGAGLRISSTAYVELQWYLFSLVILLGSPHALACNSHVRVDVFYGRLGDRGKVWIDLVGTLVFLLPFCAFALVVCWPSVANSWVVLEVSPDPGGLPRYPLKSAILVGFALLFLQGISGAVKRVAWLRGRPLWPGALPEIENEASESFT